MKVPSVPDCLTGGGKQEGVGQGFMQGGQEKIHPNDAGFLVNQEMRLEVEMIRGGDMSINKNISQLIVMVL